MSLPLKAKVTIRDFWEKEDSAVAKARKELHSVLGLEIRCDPDWPILLNGLESYYEDSSQLIKTVTDCLTLWFRTLTDILESPKHDDFADKLVGKVEAASNKLRLLVELAEEEEMSTWWSDIKKSFTIFMPKTQIYQATQYQAVLHSQILGSLEEKSTGSSLPIRSTTGDDWADVAADDSGAKVQAGMRPSADYLPDPKSLPQPTTLLSRPPYHLIIHASSTNKIQIECSHSATLEFLAEYLQLWCRTNPNLSTKSPILSIELNHATSCFGTYDYLTLFAENRYGPVFQISATTILNIVEGVLGYERISGETSSWHYRRDVAFKK